LYWAFTFNISEYCIFGPSLLMIADVLFIDWQDKDNAAVIYSF
jgi:hypothetical protein